MPTQQTLTKQDVLNQISLLESNRFFDQATKIRIQYRHILRPEIPDGATEWLQKFITQDKEMLLAKRHIGLLANHQDGVLIMGPTGTGKELLAHALHGDREKDTWISINCAGLPDGLVESELFGHVKGAFTGACETVDGLFTKAGKGTLFLDEIGELPLNIQAKLLRVIQEHSLRKVGGKFYEPFNARVVCATLQNLQERVKCGLFREDLFYRINTFVVHLTPLERRVLDIPLITAEVAKRIEGEKNIPEDKRYPKEYYDINIDLLDGNVRSIEQIIRKFHVLGELPYNTITKLQ